MSEPRMYAETLTILGHLASEDNPDHIRETVRNRRLALVIPEPDARNPNVLHAAFQAGNLLARMTAYVDVIAPAGLPAEAVPSAPSDVDFAEALSDWMTQANPHGAYRALVAPDGVYDVCLVMGRDPSAACAADALWVWPNGWNLHFRSPWSAFPDESHEWHPVAAHAAGAFGASEAVRRAFASLWPLLGSTRSFSFSLFHLRHDVAEPGPSLPTVTQLGEVVLAGLGAVGSSVVLGLQAMGTRVEGDFVPVDGDIVTPTNVPRYVMVREGDLRKPKVRVAEELLADQTSLRVSAFPMTYQGFVQQHRPDGRVDTLLVAVDTADKRRAIAALLPRAVFNAGTDTQDFLVSRHGFADGDACLACLYYKTPKELSFQERVAEDLELDLSKAQALLAGGEPVGLDIVRKVARSRGLRESDLDEHAVDPLDSFYRRVICGSELVKTHGSQAMVPLPHTSALAGSMLLLELIKERLGARSAYTSFSWSLTSRVGPNSEMALRKRPVPGCICGDLDYREANDEMWNNHSMD